MEKIRIRSFIRRHLSIVFLLHSGRKARAHPCESPERFVKAFGQLHSSLQKFLVVETLLGPTLHHLIDSKALFPAKLLIEKVRIMNNFCHYRYLLVANAKNLEQRLKSTVLPTMPKPAFVHVERDCLRWFLVLGGKGEFGLWVNKLADQPCGSHSIHTGPRPC